jgi:hypothetical protein
VSGEKGSRCESCTNSSPYFASRGMIHWETGKETDALESNPEAMSRETCLSQYRNEKVQATRNWQYEMDHRTVCGIIQFYFRCLRFLTEAFFGYIFGRS